MDGGDCDRHRIEKTLKVVTSGRAGGMKNSEPETGLKWAPLKVALGLVQGRVGKELLGKNHEAASVGSIAFLFVSGYT